MTFSTQKKKINARKGERRKGTRVAFSFDFALSHESLGETFGVPYFLKAFWAPGRAGKGDISHVRGARRQERADRENKNYSKFPFSEKDSVFFSHSPPKKKPSLISPKISQPQTVSVSPKIYRSKLTFPEFIAQILMKFFPENQGPKL